MKNSKKFWNILAKSYDKKVSRYEDAYKKMIELSKRYINPNHIVLDYACGTGITTIELSKNVKKIVAIDIAEEMIKIAKQKSISKTINNIDFKVADLSNLKDSEMKFDVILAFNILHFSNNVEEVLQQIQKLLLTSGIFLSVTDCFGDKRNLKSMFITFFSTLGLIPSMTNYTTKTLEKVIKENGFKVVESQNLFNGFPPNYFIAAEKIN